MLFYFRSISNHRGLLFITCSLYEYILNSKKHEFICVSVFANVYLCAYEKEEDVYVHLIVKTCN